MAAVKVQLVQQKETKSTVVYAAEDEAAKAVLDVVYIKKAFLGETPPKKITLTVEAS